MLTLYNTLTRQKEVFQPLHDKVVTMYNCGPTVYDYAHIGNLRGYVNADILRRLLEIKYHYRVEQIINITDVGHLTDDGDAGEDKIEKGAQREKKSVEDTIEFYTQAFFSDLKELNINPDKIYKFPRASQHIAEQIKLIETLEEKGYTYITSDGVYFDTSKFSSYGKLAGLKLDELKEGARVEVNPEKRNPTDFALWKFSPENEKRSQEWDSPWGVGFPGWHIECSAMAMKYLGETLDIHTGGIDHIPVHHTNEIAQSECATGKPFANFWLHHEFVNIKGGKMAKSEGNFIRLETLKEEGFKGVDYRYLLLLAHYRSPITFSFEALEAAENALSRLVNVYSELKEKSELDITKVNGDHLNAFFAALDDDLNTPEAIAILWNMLKDESLDSAEKLATLEKFDSVLGLDLKDLSATVLEVPEEVRELAKKRSLAKKEGNYKEADKIREKINELGFNILDKQDGYHLEKR